LVVAVALQVGVNYANDFSDGVRGTDQDRSGPIRLVGANLAAPEKVRAAAVISFAVAAATGLWLASVTSWWLVLVGAAAIAAGWYYTGGSNPYGYRALGEISVFVFFGLVATAGTTFVQAEQVTGASVLGGVGCGALACAILVANNLRDLEPDRRAGKRTLAVVLGDRRTRRLYLGLLVSAYVVVVALAVEYRWAVLALPTAALAARPSRLLARGATGTDLIAVLKDTATLLLAYGLLLSVGLTFG
jgi:1,4-dihydroxy-2-naphthoate octaprenyltransferase